MARRSDIAVDPADAQIAAIALARGAPVATRVHRTFEALGVEVIDSWRFEG